MKKPIAPSSQPTRSPSSQPTKSHESSLIDPDRDRDEELATIAMNGAVRMLQASSQLVARTQTTANDISALLKEGI